MRKSAYLSMLPALLAISMAFAQEPTPKILFLHLKLAGNQVSLLDASTAPGTLKRIAAGGPALDVEIATTNSSVLWSNAVTDPAIQRLEYEDPEHPGQLLTKVVQSTNVEFTIRVPVLPDAQKVSFYRANPSAVTNAPDARPSSLAPSADQRTLLGVVTLPADAK